ncbi:MAG: hypothetical protein HC853_09475 [Anaerolineae bacterium]|nr:hypothetical protein [Anaerolineae bacterium]
MLHLAQFLAQPETKPDPILIRAALGTDLTSPMYWQGMVREVSAIIKDLISDGRAQMKSSSSRPL